MPKTQAKGSASRLLIDFETTPNSIKAFANRLPHIFPFNSEDLQGERTLNQAETIRGDRSASEPFQGNLDVGGTIEAPIDDRLFGIVLKLLMGAPAAAVDAPIAAQNRKIGSPTLTIATGEGTFTVAQTTAAVGDVVIYTDGTTIFYGYLTAETSDTVWNIDTVRAGSSPAADIAAATVLYIVRNHANATPGTISISSGVATFSNAPGAGSLVPGSVVIYDGTKRARVKTAISSTSCVLEGVLGATPGNETTEPVEAVWTDFRAAHSFSVAPIASNPTATIDLGFLDLDVPLFLRYSGCKLDTLGLALGGDGELLASLGFLGAGKTLSYQPYDKADHWSGGNTLTISGTGGTFSGNETATLVGDYVVFRDASGVEQKALISVRGSDTGVTFSAAPGDGTALEILAIYPSADSASIARDAFGDRFQQFDGNYYLDGSLQRLLSELNIDFANNLDGDQYLIGGQGTREEIPEGIFNVSGSLVAVFKQEQLIKAASDFDTLAQRFLLTRADTGRSLDILLPETKLQERTPAVDSPAGVTYDPAFQAFKTAADSIATVILTGGELGY